MPSDRAADPWSGATYNGFSGPQDTSAPAEAPRRIRADRKVVVGGLAAAIAAGLLFGWMARSPLQGQSADLAAEAPVAKVPVEVVKPPPPVPIRSDGPLEVLPADLARAAEAARPIAAPPPRPLPPNVATSVPRAAPLAQVITPARPEPVVAEAPRDADPGFNCGSARSRAERMVCGDSELAGLDRRLNRAFDRAVGSGVPYRELRREQDDWLNIREDAARNSPGAVASVYRQRIRELNAIAEDGQF